METADNLRRERLREWRRRLVEGGRAEALPVEARDLDGVFDQLLRGGPGFRLTPSRPERPARGELRVEAAPQEMADLHERARTAREQFDLHLAHLAIGALQGRPARTEAEPFAPLLLVPVELTRLGDDHSYRLRAGPHEPLLNPGLAWLPQARGVTLPSPDPDWSVLRPSAWLDAVEGALGDRDIRVERRLYLALLPVGRWLLHQRLEAEEGALASHPVVRFLAGEPATTPARGATRPHPGEDGGSAWVWPIDAEQHAALKAARQDTPLVGVGGPAGSGRTQVLANLLAASIAEGQTSLVVGRTPAGLEAVRKRLAGAGLDRYCLLLRGGATSGSELFGELRRALPDTPEAARPVPGGNEAKRGARARLAGYLRELHERRWPLDRSVAEVLTELAGLQAEPSLAWRHRQAELLTTEQLTESLELAARLLPLLDLAREEEAAPWERCREPGSSVEPAEEWRRRLGRAQAAVDRLHKASSALAASHGLSAPGSPAEVERILDLDAWLLRDPPPPDHWLGELDVAAAREEAEWWQERMGAYQSEKARVLVSFSPALFELPEDALEDLEEAARRLELPLGRSAGIILDVRRFLEGWIAHTRAALPEWRALAERLAEATGLAGLPIHMEGAQRLAVLARLLGRPERPPAHWMDHRECARVETVLRDAGELQQRLNKVRRAVLSVYTTSVTTIAAESLIADFVGSYAGRWRFLRPGYHRALRLLRRHRLDHRTPANPLSELRKIRFFRHCTAALEALTARHRELLGDYAPALTGALSPARKALETARALLERAGTADVEAITRRLRGPALPPEAASWLSQLEASLERNGWQMTRCQGALPAGAVPGHGVPLRELPLDVLGTWLGELGQALTGLDERLARARALMVSGDKAAFGFEEALDALIRLAGLRSFERKLEADTPHLRSVYGALFRGLDTDWPAVLDALDAVENARRAYGAEGPPARGRAARGSASGPAECRQLLGELTSLFDELDGRFEQAHSRRRYPLDPTEGWGALAACLARLAAGIDRREDWVELGRLRQEFEIAELAWLFQELRAREVSAGRALPAVRKAALSAWWQAQRADCPALGEFDRRGMEDDIAAFREEERGRRQQALRAVVTSAEARRPPADALDGVGDAAALGLRALTLQLRDILRTLKPVVMACPFTAGLLPREMVFDRVVVHESEPIPVEEAVAALARGRQATVLGAWPRDGESPHGLLDEVAAAGGPTLRLSGDYRAPGDDGAAGWAQAVPAESPSALREGIARAVRGLGHEVVERAGPGNGVALLWVLPRDGQGQPLLGIDATDAEPGSARRTLAERYGIVPDFAERLGIPLHRIHAVEWVEDHASAVDGLRQALRRAAGDTGARRRVPASEPGVAEPVPYVVASLDGFALEPATLREPGQRETLAAAVRHLVSVEGPVHGDRVAARILEACGGRPGRRGQPGLDQALRVALEEGAIEAHGRFLQAPGGAALRVRTPRAGEPRSRRRLSELPPQEILLAAEMLLGSAGRRRRTALLAALSRLFGLGKDTRRAELEKALRSAAGARLAFEGDSVCLRRD